MTEEDLKHFKNILEEKHASIVEDLGTIENQSLKTTAAESSGDLAYSDHMPDLGSAAMEREKAFMFASRDGAYLDQVEAALTRIECQTFGICRSCGCEIPRERLEAVPTTQVCVPCKETENTAKSA
ncbi:MAG: TraR/DksA C4-type zinc finger protein [Candidatus Latescibacteria bacterium]|jgi:RNA polymerase-binding protein DksA|nr:TraR/DksA C4-type zinc finger protein [Candidatus Latescibacterota bacterium]